MGRGFESGGYKCECLQGFEYPFEDPITYYDGQLVEAEFQNIVANEKTRYDTFKCRLAGASDTKAAGVLVAALLIFSSLYIYLKR